MNAIRAIWMNGQILPAEPIDWPNGSELVVEPMATLAAKIGVEEAEWRDDAEALADWDVWLRTIEPLALSDEERAASAQYNEEFRRYNLEAVRRQMTSGGAA